MLPFDMTDGGSPIDSADTWAIVEPVILRVKQGDAGVRSMRARFQSKITQDTWSSLRKREQDPPAPFGEFSLLQPSQSPQGTSGHFARGCVAPSLVTYRPYGSLSGHGGFKPAHRQTQQLGL